MHKAKGAEKDVLGYSFSEAAPLDVLGHKIEVVSAGDVTHEGSCYVFGNGIEVRTAVRGMPLCTLAASLPRWWAVKPPLGMRFVLRFRSSGFIATVGGLVVSGAQGLSANQFPGAVSRGLSVYSQDVNTAAATTNATKVAALLAPRIGFPGGFIGSNAKTGTTQATAGRTVQVTPATPVPIYAHVRYYVPQGANTVGPGTAQLSSPLYLWLETSAAVVDGDAYDAKQWIIGDLGTLNFQSGPTGVVMVCALPVVRFGYWSPANEETLEPTSVGRYARLDTGLWNLASSSRIAGGGGGEPGTGGLPPSGTGAGVGFGSVAV